MAHDLEEQTNGTFSYVGARTPAWHGLGVTYPDRTALHVDEVLTDLNVGEIHTATATATLITDDGVFAVEDPTQKMVIRVRGTEAVSLGVVGADYTVIDERAAFRFLDHVIDAGQAVISSAGLLDGGRRAFCCAQLPEQIMIGGRDAVDLYMVVTTSHNGTASFVAAATPIRVVCQNTLHMALRHNRGMYRLRHTSRAQLRVQDARAAMSMTFAYGQEFAAEAEAMIARACSDADFARYVDIQLAPTEEELTNRRTAGNWDVRRHKLYALWRADTQADVRGTWWGAFNAVAEYVDWAQRIRTTTADPATARFERALTQSISGGAGQGAKDRAYALAASM